MWPTAGGSAGVPRGFRGVPRGVPRGFEGVFRGGSVGFRGGSGGFRVGFRVVAILLHRSEIIQELRLATGGSVFRKVIWKRGSVRGSSLLLKLKKEKLGI